MLIKILLWSQIFLVGGKNKTTGLRKLKLIGSSSLSEYSSSFRPRLQMGEGIIFLSHDLMELVHDHCFPLVEDCQCNDVIGDLNGGYVGVS